MYIAVWKGEQMSTKWQVETLRITVFPSEIAEVSVAKLWDSVIGRDPDEIRFQRGKIDAREVEFGNGRLVLAKQDDRIDWLYLSKPAGDLDSERLQLPIIGNLEGELKTFTAWANPWFESSDMHSITRLAFGAVLLIPVKSVEEGNSVLSDFLPNMNLRNVRDFNYQGNRRRQSRVDSGIVINRLSKWNVYSGQLMKLAANPMQAPQVYDPKIACRLELDINTFQERREPLPTRKLSKMFKELVKLGIEISEKGDIP